MNIFQIILKWLRMLFSEPEKFLFHLKNLLASPVNFFELFKIRKISYSQFWEDLIVNAFLWGNRNGFYVDIGTYDPKYLSNTYFFYKKGWTGINIEPNLVNFQKIRKYRKRDINLNMWIGRKEGDMEFFMLDMDYLNTFDPASAEDYQRQGHKLLGVKTVPVRKMEKIFDEYLPNGKEIDFLSVDTEGYDMEVLLSNNWKKYRPKIVILETKTYSLEGKDEKLNGTFDPFFTSIGYVKFADTYLNTLYMAEECAKRYGISQ